MGDEEDYLKGEIEPMWKKKFNVCEITTEMKSIIRGYFEKNKYSPEDATEMSQELSRLIRDGIINSARERDKLRMPRHKIIVQVLMGQKKEQKISILSKGYWDTYVDNYAKYTYEEDDFYCTAVVLGFYTD